ncbi:MAG: methyltransferase domain-containing protein [Bacteroidota bacterium]|nr:methyltransferase domain-containing protein [Bacteroidota bacterium]MDP4248698.1 methyltransferase domain-containing protein [Bacteroidota bacterium]
MIDVGCGSAYKLVHLFENYSTLGIELSDTYNWLTEKYPDKKWMSYEHANPAELNGDLVICSDVIEHIKNPDEMMDFLQKMHFRFLILSTPERDEVRGNNDFGPPENTAHYREWNKREFRNYVSAWFKVQEHLVFDDKSVTQVVVCNQRG